MPVVELNEIKELMPKRKRLLGIDHGTKTWGLAIANPAMTMATPLQTIRFTKFSKNILELAAICKEWEIGGFIIGLPLNMDGTSGGRVESVRHFGDNLINAKDILGFDPIIAFFDERLSTHTVESFLIEEINLSREKRAQVIDKLAAQVILQGALNEIKGK